MTRPQCVNQVQLQYHKIYILITECHGIQSLRIEWQSQKNVLAFMEPDHSLPCSQEPAIYVHSWYSFPYSSGFSFLLHVFYVVGISMSLKWLTSFYIAVIWYNRGMILFCCLKTCAVVIRYVLICFLFITDANWWSIEWTGSKWFWWYGKEICVSLIQIWLTLRPS